MTNEAIQMRISLEGIEPEIWRRFVVDSSISLHRLHEIIQTVMGWENEHLYSFVIQKTEYQLPVPGGDPFGFMGAGRAPVNAKKTMLHGLELRPRQKFRYTYDFGDDWVHTILVEKVTGIEGCSIAPVCLEGERSCPIEDCGSIPGYEHILHILKNAETDDDKELLEWVGEGYDPESFDLKGVNAALKRKKRVSRK